MSPSISAHSFRLPVAAITVGAILVACPVLAADGLELKRVLLSTGGVGYFEYEAEVVGDQTLDISVPLDQVDDVMKSIVVYDDRGGVGEISLPGQEPLREVFRELPFGPEALGSPVDLLNALRGAEIRATGTREIAGRILSVAAETARDEDGTETVRHRVSLLTPAGVRQFILEETDTLTFADETVQADLDRALAALSQLNARDRRTLSIRSTGADTRRVRVAYVVEAPLWKTSYRLTVSSDPAAETAALQGWAVLENMSGEDWNGVDLTVVSGNPVTFRQALYDAYYVERPEVPVEVLGRVLPGIDKRARDLDGIASEAPMESYAEAMPAPPPSAAADMAAPHMAMAGAPAPLGRAQVTAAQSTEATAQVVFHLPEPVTVERGRSLLVPIVDRAVPAETVDLYQAEVQPDHPLAAVRIDNDGETGLPPGVLTLYQSDAASGLVTYVGDARLGALPAGEERLLSFAVDQAVTVEQEREDTGTISRARLVDGVLTLTRTQQSHLRYTVTGAAREDRTVLLDGPKYDGWTLVSPPKDTVSVVGDHYRLRTVLPAGKTTTVDLVQEQPYDEVVDLADARPDLIGAYAEAREIPADLRAALARLATRLAAIADRQAETDRLQARLAEIGQEQARIRSNLESVPENSDLYQRYIGKLGSLETEIEETQSRHATMEQALAEARKRYREEVRRLSL
jgi:hypothetical protein